MIIISAARLNGTNLKMSTTVWHSVISLCMAEFQKKKTNCNKDTFVDIRNVIPTVIITTVILRMY